MPSPATPATSAASTRATRTHACPSRGTMHGWYLSHPSCLTHTKLKSMPSLLQAQALESLGLGPRARRHDGSAFCCVSVCPSARPIALHIDSWSLACILYTRTPPLVPTKSLPVSILADSLVPSSRPGQAIAALPSPTEAAPVRATLCDQSRLVLLLLPPTLREPKALGLRKGTYGSLWWPVYLSRKTSTSKP